MASIGAREGEFSLQIAPMLDVLSVLLLFFMVAAGSMKRETSLVTHLPTGGSKPVPVRITVDASGEVALNGVPYDAVSQNALPMTLDRLKRMVANDPNLSVLIEPAPATRQQRVVDVMNACTQAGVQHLGFGSSEQ